MSAAANRRAIRVGQEPLDLFRSYAGAIASVGLMRWGLRMRCITQGIAAYSRSISPISR